MKDYIRVKRLIKKAFVINYSIPKGYGTRSSDYYKYYNQKLLLISKASTLKKITKITLKILKLEIKLFLKI